MSRKRYSGWLHRIVAIFGWVRESQISDLLVFVNDVAGHKWLRPNLF